MEIRLGMAALMAGAVLAAPPALAQEALSNDAPTARDATDEIVVSARRREERLQEVPLAISVRTQEELDQFNIESVGDLQFFTPSLQVFGPYRDQPIPSIRGQGGYTPGGIPSVLMYLNEVPAATSSQAGSPGGMLGGNDLFFDLQSVEVVKGPQGTLFGRNTTGGAILVQSRRPQRDFGGYINVAGGNYGNREIEGALNLPVIEDELFLRVALSAQNRDGFTQAVSTPSHPDGLDLDDSNYYAMRFSLLHTPTSSIENLLIFDYINNDNNGTSSVLRDVTSNGAHPINILFPGLQGVLTEQNERGIRSVGALSADMHGELERWSVTDIFSWDLTDNLTFKNILSYQDAEYFRTVDGDGSVYPIFDPVQSQARPFLTRQFSAESQLQFSDLFGGLLNGTIGAFYLDSPENDDFSQHTNVVFGRLRIVGIANSEQSKAIFAQTDINLGSILDGLSATAGARYTWETISRKTRDYRIPANTCTSPYANANCVSQRSGDFEAPTWTVGLNYQVTPDTLVYVASRHGFRSGGFNLEGDTPADQVSFDEENVTDIEFGLKTDWSIGSVSARTNVAAYRQYYDDIQLPQFSTSAITGATLTVIRNGGKAEINGLEVEQRFFFGDSFELGGVVSVIDFEYTELGPDIVPPVIPTVPDYTFTIDAAYHLLRDPEIGDVSVRAAWSQSGDRYTASLIDQFAFQEEFGLLTLGADWRNIAGRPVDLSFFMTNATDEEYQVGGLPLSSTVGMSTVAYGEPRMWGLRLGYRFGADAGY